MKSGVRKHWLAPRAPKQSRALSTLLQYESFASGQCIQCLSPQQLRCSGLKFTFGLYFFAHCPSLKKAEGLAGNASWPETKLLWERTNFAWPWRTCLPFFQLCLNQDGWIYKSQEDVSPSAASGGIALFAPPTGFWKAGWLRASPLRRSCSSLDWSHVAKGKEILCWAPEPGVTNSSHQCATGSMIWTELRTVANFLLNACRYIGTINWERPDFKEKKQFFLNYKSTISLLQKI